MEVHHRHPHQYAWYCQLGRHLPGWLSHGHQTGQPGRALSISTMASTFGGLFSACALLFTAPLLSKIALNFGVPEMFALGVFGLSIVTAVSSHSIIKGLIGAILGLLLGTVGIDATSATMRFTFGTTYLSEVSSSWRC